MKKTKNPLNYIVSHYLKQVLDVHLQYHVVHATCHIFSGFDLISIFELIKNITALFSTQKKKKDTVYFVDISNIPECHLCYRIKYSVYKHCNRTILYNLVAT